MGRFSVMDEGDDTAQITPKPKEFIDKMVGKVDLEVVLCECIGVEAKDIDGGENSITGVKYIDRETKKKNVRVHLRLMSALLVQGLGLVKLKTRLAMYLDFLWKESDLQAMYGNNEIIMILLMLLHSSYFAVKTLV